MSWATNLGPTDQNGTFGYDVFVHDCVAGTTEGVSVDANGMGGDRDSDFVRMSADGRFAIFTTGAFNLLPHYGDSPGQLLLRDLQAQTTTAVSVTPLGRLTSYGNLEPSISPDGRFVAFEATAWDYAATGGYYHTDVFFRDLQLGVVEMVSVDPTWGLSEDGAWRAAVSADGRFVAFQSRSTNLVSGDTNGVDDIFLRDRAPASVAYSCFGDGTGASCPCSNAGVPFHGCQNSATTGGAVLSANGLSKLGQDSLRITSSGMRPTALTVLMQGDATVAPQNYGDGLRCIAGHMKRLCAKSAQRGIVVYPEGSDLPISQRSAALGDPIPAGESRSYQSLYRDPAIAFCPSPTGSTFNASSAISAVWDP